MGPTKAYKREAEQIAKPINAALVSGTYLRKEEGEEELACDQQLKGWLVAYVPTLKATTRKLYSDLIDKHLAPYFGSRDLRTVSDMKQAADELRAILNAQSDDDGECVAN